jgi:hypothetical protein
LQASERGDGPLNGAFDWATNIDCSPGILIPTAAIWCHAIADAYQSAVLKKAGTLDRIEIAHHPLPSQSMDWESGDLPVGL